ncbi:hypothetical protein VFPPC_17414 [Pochonia chlamydosporia 170]|uniref:Uncharacterized protein n=1 Tax=Pochonia chlamydosporia 170 TaxID=1380566 RepID=A0A219ARP9_METCM|nr:hypothetical protein VFPPC_17414 [Pochonia chlamydosporia 170]OWT43437.1 hypothetical protein VFPPC_17414 [Pochonia chlamydosporia 170]
MYCARPHWHCQFVGNSVVWFLRYWSAFGPWNGKLLDLRHTHAHTPGGVQFQNWLHVPGRCSGTAGFCPAGTSRV